MNQLDTSYLITWTPHTAHPTIGETSERARAFYCFFRSDSWSSLPIVAMTIRGLLATNAQ